VPLAMPTRCVGGVFTAMTAPADNAKANPIPTRMNAGPDPHAGDWLEPRKSPNRGRSAFL
jgi:hypothetical protein